MKLREKNETSREATGCKGEETEKNRREKSSAEYSPWRIVFWRLCLAKLFSRLLRGAAKGMIVYLQSFRGSGGKTELVLRSIWEFSEPRFLCYCVVHITIRLSHK